MSNVTRRAFLAAPAAASLAGRLRALDPAKLRLGVTSDEIDDDLETAIAFLKRFDLRYVEIRNLWGKYNTSLPAERVRSARKLLDGAGIKTCILDTGFFKVPLPAETPEGQKALDKQWDLLDRAMERARILGTDKIRMFAFTYGRGEQLDPTRYPRIIELLTEAARRAKGFRLALENVGRSYVATAAHSAKILAAVHDERLGLTWDPNNSAAEGDPSPYPDGYKLLDPARIFHVHLRDYRRLPGGGVEWCGVGDGEFDHVGQIRAMLNDGYQEAFSLETHFRIEGSKAKASEFSIKGLLKAIRQV